MTKWPWTDVIMWTGSHVFPKLEASDRHERRYGTSRTISQPQKGFIPYHYPVSVKPDSIKKTCRDAHTPNISIFFFLFSMSACKCHQYLFRLDLCIHFKLCFLLHIGVPSTPLGIVSFNHILKAFAIFVTSRFFLPPLDSLHFFFAGDVL